MAITITSGSISFDGQEFKKGDVTASKEFETKRKSDSGIPLKRLRAFTSASTFIDFNTDKRGQTKGQSIDVYVKDTYEALHINPNKVSIGPKPNVALELTGSISTDSTDITLEASSNITISGSTYLSGSTVVPQPWLDALNFATGSNPVGTYGLIMDGGIVTTGIITADNALSIMPGTGLIHGALGTMGGVGNSQVISQDTIVQPNYNTILYVNNNNDSITVNAGVNYTISMGADVTIKLP